MSLPVELTAELTKLAPSAIVELFVLDATDLGGDVLRFHAGTNGLSQNVVWQGDTYVRFPIQVTGFEITGQGQLPRPKMQISNVLSAITTVILQYNDLLGAKVTRKRTMVKFLDAVNFPGGVNANEDPTAEFENDVYYIDRKSSEDKDLVEFELASLVDLVGIALPRRQVIQNVCIWRYRGTECGYTGSPRYDGNDDPITSASSAEGTAVLNAYAARDTAAEELAEAEEVLNAATQAMGSACEYSFQSSDYEFISLGAGLVTGVLVYATGTVVAKVAGVSVSLGLQYRRGALEQDAGPVDYYEIETWAQGAGCAAATTAYNTAKTDRDTKATALATAETNLATALAALPDDDPLYSRDVCGKRLSSCKLRFGENEALPFGSFPAAGLIK